MPEDHATEMFAGIGAITPSTPPGATGGRAAAPDQIARDRITTDLVSTLFVEAGAGSGKTTALVDRVVELVATAGIDLRSIAAVTFTEKAAAELRDRVRRQLEKRAEADAVSQPEVAERCRTALDQLDGAAIGTLHAFAQRVLSENPVEAGLPPRLEVLDEVSSGVAFTKRWNVERDRLLEDPAIERTLLLLLATGVRHESLRLLAEVFEANWDLVEERIPATAPDPPSVRSKMAPIYAAIDAVCRTAEACNDPDDKFFVRVREIAAWVHQLMAIDDDEELLAALTSKNPGFRAGNVGKAGAFPGCDLKQLKADLREAGELIEGVPSQIASACVHRLAVEIRRFTLEAAAERRVEGRLEFHDLLVMARSLLRDPEHGPAVRTRLHSRYQRLLLDEFQDTDPIQIELAVRIAAASPASPEAGSARWDEVPLDPGHLFVVGDPKQSIYRFRRADIATFLAARTRLGGDDLVVLDANFRTVKPVIDWVNTVFAALMDAAADAEVDVPSPDYRALTPVRPAVESGPPVSVIGRAVHPPKSKAEVLRAAEAADVAAAIGTAMAEGWTVSEDRGGEVTYRPCRLGDITVLVPARTSLPFLEDALGEAGIAYRAESSSLVYATRAVRDLLMVLRAVDDPTDALNVVSALRTPLLACGDDDLYRYRVERKGSWSLDAPVPEDMPADDPVAAALTVLRGWHAQRVWLSPSELLERIVRDRRAFELGVAEGRPRDVWRRLRFVVDQARAWSDATGGGLRQYLGWVGQQTVEGARVAEAVLPETDDDAVRIMTIHAAKGLEFPITILSGMSTKPSGNRASVEVVFPPHGDVGYRFGKFVRTEEYEDYKPIDEQMALDERLRLLYVAATRARDHLIVSLHRIERAKDAGSRRTLTNAELLVDAMGPDLLESLPDAAGLFTDGRTPLAATVPTAPAPFAEWKAELDTALARASTPSTVAATALSAEGGLDVEGEPADGLRKRPRDLDLPPWLKGRYGTAVGRAVHAVLQTVDLATGEGLDAAVAAQCQAEAITGREDDVRTLAAAALGSPSVRAAAAAGPQGSWREIFACAPVGDRLVEGYVDLLYRGDDGLVVVDYKTASTADPVELDRRVEGYRLQGASYALVIGETTGEEVAGVVFVFLTPDGAVERRLTDLKAAVDDVRALVAAGGEVLVPEAVTG